MMAPLKFILCFSSVRGLASSFSGVWSACHKLKSTLRSGSLVDLCVPLLAAGVQGTLARGTGPGWETVCCDMPETHPHSFPGFSPD